MAIGASYESDEITEARKLRDALEWLTEMAGYAVNNLDPEWARLNRGDLVNAIEQAEAALR